ncbi:Basic-leucine zipper (bZIP) transcription factor family protein [Actinidia rufa]|uniref:Basic-leucine zipper (BZIP) transcription factor family protein n=1 Tax=Actinidia rufa TaxID=165716 RepID=A0A7J0DJM2_9ERIC|nr:Basic-leucine zipper (bZIP) transcription factor family protein [Actinidia rufa]
MDDGEPDFFNPEGLWGSNICSYSMDHLLNEIPEDTHTCTHTHTCNPPGPDSTHTHTCVHVHTKIMSGPAEDKFASTARKKKAQTASLEDEVVSLRTLTQQLMKRLEGQAALEAEIARLKRLLVDIRGRIEGEIGSFPYQKPVRSGNMYQNLANTNLPGAYMTNPCNMQCDDDQVYCLQPGVERKSGEGALFNGQGFSDCEFENLQCLGNQSAGLKECPSCGIGHVSSMVNSSGGSKRKR